MSRRSRPATTERPRSRRSIAPAASRPRVLFVHKKSAYQVHVRERKNRRIQALIEAGDRTVRNILAADRDHVSTIEEARQACKDLGVRGVFRYRSDDELMDDFSLVVTIGGDGTLLWVSHRVGSGLPVLAINSAPDHSVGHFCGGRKGHVREALEAALDRRLKPARLTRMEVRRDDTVLHSRVLNDALFCHKSPAATTRYLIARDGIEEAQKSSGMWVGPAAGSTAAIRSAGGRILPPGSRKLQFVVREPYHPPFGAYRLRRGLVGSGDELVVYSQMREGRLYIDGPRVMHEVGIGDRLTFRESDEPLKLLAFPRALGVG